MKSAIVHLDSHMGYCTLKYVNWTQTPNMLIRINVVKPFS
jgi:hypothetical protein